ncbi:MAG: hypothetical protein M1274_07625 [Actinobacteria bacterium]|nr:hypothetical protein [Actinomycetota bacterium]
MGYRLAAEDRSEAFVVSLNLALDRRESNELFLSGDSMIAWPRDGLSQDGNPLIARTSMFVSEIAGRPTGLALRYATREQAQVAENLLRRQLDQIGIAEEE